MKVFELANELNISIEAVLVKLKALKLKAKGKEQELNKAVGVVVRGELVKDVKAGKIKTISPEDKKAAQEVKVEQEKELEVKESEEQEVKKKTVKKATIKKTTTRKVSKAKQVAEEEKDTVKEEKPKKKAVVKKKTAIKAKGKEEKEVQEKEKAEKTVIKEKKVEETAKAQPKKTKPKISSAPFIPLKPLVKKKRKSIGRGEEAKVFKKGEFDVGAVPPDMVTPGVEPGSPEAVAAQEARLANLKELELKIPISVKDFSVRVEQKTSVVLKKLMQMGIFSNINQGLGEDIVRKLAEEFGYKLTKVKTQEQQLVEWHKEEDENPDLLKPRAPVVTFMGHVDHGKTSLIDKIRKSKLADAEHGGITQHIGAYSVKLPKGRITFLDTPGHEAFTAMRARGAHITDLVVVVIAADEGIMPQTEEAIDHSHAAGVPIIIALNKIDRRNADVDRVKKQLADRGLSPEDWGGKTIVANVSAITGEGIDTLLEMILLEAEMLELKANSEKKASGIVVEAHLSHGRGSVASLIVQGGTLRMNDIVVAGQYYGKMKALFDCLERPIQGAGPSTPVEILGLPGVPEAGEMFYVVEDEKQAREITLIRQRQLKDQRLNAQQRVTLEDIYSQIQDGTIKELNVILKADVQGSLEALKDSLEKIPSDEVKVKFIHTGVGDINASDVILAVASNAIIIAFHVGQDARAKEELEKQPVDVREYRIIYDAVNDMRQALEGLLAPKKRRKFLARIDVRQVFKLSKSGMVAGCFIAKGTVTRKANVDVVRDGEVAHSGVISTLKRFKDDVKEVKEGYECGIAIDGYEKIQEGDVLEVYEIETIARTL
ncbi:MAG: translation initiation factor IF-2 [Candidatus Omnitrophica bacterium]|nr:translation initiation factor IF-2 [Candidatus Omnitrophota bacterium]